jgi:hypothetical protein
LNNLKDRIHKLILIDLSEDNNENRVTLVPKKKEKTFGSE